MTTMQSGQIRLGMERERIKIAVVKTKVWYTLKARLQKEMHQLPAGFSGLKMKPGEDSSTEDQMHDA